ncbi:MAG: DUF1616 domain-containing protein [Candidatus Bathyarchaeota archaeon]|nr:DUF1616 domain-containing protein [Candidatus Bathyarchaeum tardum]WGM90023.1 MAG: DUF1616 domain-containing protein [Candidatus Bathyarchaeum tardum]
MTNNNNDEFMEKKIKKTSKTESSAYSNEEKTVILTIAIAVVIIGALLVQLTLLTPINAEKCSALYYLDSNKQTENLPSTIILGENSTFSLWVGVENQNNEPLDYQVLMKIDDGKGVLNQSSAEVIEYFDQTLEDNDIWEFPVEITIEKLGTNRIIFELFIWNATATEYQYSGIWVNLSVEAIEASA